MNYLSSSPAPPLRLCHARMPQAIPAKPARRMFKSKWQKTRTRKQVISRVGFGSCKSMVHVWNELGTMGMSKVRTGIRMIVKPLVLRYVKDGYIADNG